MKILYAIQGTGNGHICRAREIVPLLQQHGNVDVLISGTQVDLKLDQPITYRHHGFSFFFGKNGGVNHWESFKAMDLRALVKDIRNLPVKDYDLILNDFEPITAWACKLRKIPSVSLSHQASFSSKYVPKPKSIDWGELILKHYAPTTDKVGFHFKKYDDFIFTPVIRSEVRKLQATNAGHYTVYLPAIDDRKLVPLLKKFSNIRWEVFSKHATFSYESGNISVRPVENAGFYTSLASSQGLFTGGGFEGPSEAMFLNKKVLVAPMKYQYEQQCNAIALRELNIPIIWGSNSNWEPIISKWLNTEQNIKIEFPDETRDIVQMVVDKFGRR